jgi:hypothetical protein
MTTKTKQRIFFVVWIAAFYTAMELFKSKFGILKISIAGLLIGFSGLWLVKRFNRPN